MGNGGVCTYTVASEVKWNDFCVFVLVRPNALISVDLSVLLK